MPGETARPAGTQTQAERRRKSEQALLDAAAALIAERGVEQTSLARIGESAGTSRGLPTHHFGSKDALVARLARRTQDRVRGRDAERPRAWRPAPPRASPRSTCCAPPSVPIWSCSRTRLRRSARHRHVGRDVSVAGFHRRHVGGGSAQLRRLGRADRTAARRTGRSGRDLDPTAAAVVLFGMMRGVAALRVDGVRCQGHG